MPAPPRNPAGLVWIRRRARIHAARPTGYDIRIARTIIGALRVAHYEVVLLPRALLLLRRRWIHIQLGLGCMAGIRRTVPNCCVAWVMLC
jgi:hypothetical protein